MRNQLLAIVGHGPNRADELAAFDDEYPMLAAAIGAAAPPDAKNAQRLHAAFQRLSTRVDGQ